MQQFCVNKSGTTGVTGAAGYSGHSGSTTTIGAPGVFSNSSKYTTGTSNVSVGFG